MSTRFGQPEINDHAAYLVASRSDRGESVDEDTPTLLREVVDHLHRALIDRDALVF